MLLAKFILELLDTLCVLTCGITASVKGCCCVLKKLFLPGIQDRWLQVVLVAQVRDRNPFSQVTLEDRYFYPRVCNCDAFFAWTFLRSR